MDWLPSAHMAIITAYAIGGYVVIYANGTQSGHVAAYLAGLCVLLLIALWHWREGYYG